MEGGGEWEERNGNISFGRAAAFHARPIHLSLAHRVVPHIFIPFYPDRNDRARARTVHSQTNNVLYCWKLHELARTFR